MPILILAGAVLFVALILELIRLAAYSEVEFDTEDKTVNQPVNVQTSGNVFDNIHKQYPTYKDVASQLVQRKITFEPHNYVLGNASSKVKVVIFNDNDCEICRAESQRLTRVFKPLLKDILVIYKHMPADKNKDSMPAIFGQIAIRKGVYDKFLNEVSAYKSDLKTTEDYLVLLEKIGVSLQDQRQIMINDMANILKSIQNDVDQATAAGAYESKHQPVIYLNGYQLGQRYLPEHKMIHYIERLLKGEDIVPKDDEQALQDTQSTAP